MLNDTAPKLFLKFHNQHLSNAWSYFWRSFCQLKSILIHFLMFFADMVYLGQNCFNSLFDRITIVKVHSEPAIFAWNPKTVFAKKPHLRCFTWNWMRFCIMAELLETIDPSYINWCQHKPKVKNNLKDMFKFR